ncbi:MAG: hypothetical protein KIT72_14100 [Polyangiaceae bacterium]|nr:hypothetical protein [Polyangiaceae bacterium]MCW5791545.1 hypothetical protein [Polyangiaceae bacterium]
MLRPVSGSERWAEHFGELDRVTVHTVARSGERRAFGEWGSPITSFALGRGPVSRFELTGPGIRGSSVWLDPAGLAGHHVPLLVGPPDRFGVAATLDSAPEQAAVVAERYILTTLGHHEAQSAEGRLYDLALLEQSPPFALPCPGVSCQIDHVVVIGGWIGVFIGPEGARYLDFQTGAQGTVRAPDGASFGDVSGGQLVSGPEGIRWLVGATRGAGSHVVLQIAADGKLSFLHLGAPRTRAAASYFASHGLVIYGGHPEAPGGELLAPGATTFRALELEPDATEGATLMRIEHAKLLRLSGSLEGAPAPTQVVKLGCATPCPLEPYEHELSLSPLQLLSHEGDTTLARIAVSDGTGEQVVRLDLTTSPPSWEAVASLERSGTQLLTLPNGQVARLGGDEHLEIHF